MATLRAMLEQRTRLTGQMREILDGTADGALPAEAQHRFDALRGEADALQVRIDRQAVVDEFERRAAGQPLGSTGDQRLDQATSQVGLLDVIRAGMGATDAGAGRAREISAELARRSGRPAEGIFWHTGAGAIEQRVTTSGTTVATDLRPDLFIQKLYAATRVRQLGATVLSGLVGNVDIPRLSGSTTAGWVAENSALTASDPTFDKVSLRPKHAGVLTEFSRNMLLQSTPAVEELVRNDMARLLAVTLDTAAVSGSGSSNQPTGVLNTSGVSSAAYNTATADIFSYAQALAETVANANAEMGSLAYLSNYKVRNAARSVKDSMGRPLGEDVVFGGMPRQFTSTVPSNITSGSTANCSPIIYGNWNDVLIGLWSELDVLVNPYESTAYSKGNVQVRAMMTVDIEVRHPESFAVTYWPAT